MADYNTINEFAGTGTVMTIAISFKGNRPGDTSTLPYIELANVQAEIYNPATTTTGPASSPMALVRVNDTTFRTTGTVPLNRILRVYRNTNSQYGLVDFMSLQVVTEADLDLLTRQAVYVSAEAKDQSARAVELASDALTNAAASTVASNSATSVAAIASNRSLQAIATANAAASAANSAVETSAAALTASASASVAASAALVSAENALTAAIRAENAAGLASTSAGNAEAYARLIADAIENSDSAAALAANLVTQNDPDKGASIVGYNPGVTNGVGRDLSSKVRELSVSLTDFGAVSGTDCTVAFQRYMAWARFLPAEQRVKLLIPQGEYGTTVTVEINSYVTVEFIGEIKMLARPTDNYDTCLLPLLGATNVTFINPRINLNKIPSMNGMIFRSAVNNCFSFGGVIRGGKHAKTGSRGGRGFNIESPPTGLFNRRNIVVTGLRVYDCYMGFGIQGGDQKGTSNFVVSNITIDSCDVAFWMVGNSDGFPHQPKDFCGIVSNITFRNCGRNTEYTGQSAPVVADRCSNVYIGPVVGFNDPDYGSVDAVVQGNYSNTDLHVVFSGASVSAIRFSPYKESDGLVNFESSIINSRIHIDVNGALDTFIANTFVPALPEGETVNQYVKGTSLSGSAISIASNLAVAIRYVTMNGLYVDIKTLNNNARIKGPCHMVGGALFTTNPGMVTDMGLNRVGAIQAAGDISSRSNIPAVTLYDTSTNSKDFRMRAEANAWEIRTDSVVDSGAFDRMVIGYADNLSVGSFYAAGVKVGGWDAVGMQIGPWVAQTGTVTMTGYITVRDVGGVTRKIPTIA